METTTKKLADRITKECAYVDVSCVWAGDFNSQKHNDEMICETQPHTSYPTVSKRSTIESEANAELIAEAFNVTNETGLSPRELAEQRNELVGEIGSVLYVIEKYDLADYFNVTALTAIMKKSTK